MGALYSQSFTKEERFSYNLNWGHNWMKAKCPSTAAARVEPDVEIVFRDRKLVEIKFPSSDQFSDYQGYWTMIAGIVEAIEEIQQSWKAKE